MLVHDLPQFKSIPDNGDATNASPAKPGPHRPAKHKPYRKTPRWPFLAQHSRGRCYDLKGTRSRMSNLSDYERLQIESLRGDLPDSDSPDPTSGLFLMPERPLAQLVFETAVTPAFRATGLNPHGSRLCFTSDSMLRDVYQAVCRAQVIVADLTDFSSDVVYVLGLCHGIGRSPLLIARRPALLPFGLDALRTLEYDDSKEGFVHLREQLIRALRIFLTTPRPPKDQ
jgi:hypothetical protein